MRISILLGLTVVLLAGPAAATTVVPAADPGELAMDSTAVFLARAGSSQSLARARFLTTVTEVEVLSVVKGPLVAGQTVRVSVPGGEAGGVGWAVAGSPRLKAGEVYLLFADLSGDGLWRPRLLAASVLQRTAGVDGAKNLEPMPEASQISSFEGGGQGVALVPGPVDEAKFLARVRRAVAGETGWEWAPMLVEGTGMQFDFKMAPSGCAFLVYEDGGGNKIRWRKFDRGQSQNLYADIAGDDDIGEESFARVSNALDRWMNVSSTSLDLNYAGTKSIPDFCTGEEDDTPPSRTDAVVFNDPCDDIADLVGCGGTLAFGGPFFYVSTYSYDDQLWHEAVSWFVVVNNGVGNCISLTDYELVLTHELGHGLGFGHTADTSSLMYENCCSPHNHLDVTCTQYLYPLATTTPTPTPAAPTPTPTPTPTRTPNPTRTPVPTVEGAARVTVPVVAHLDGVSGAPWRSDVTIANRQPDQLRLNLCYQPENGGPITVERVVPGFGTLLIEDIIADLFGGGDGRGPLRVETLNAVDAAPVIVARTLAEEPSGNFGSGLPTDIEPMVAVMSLPGLFDDQEFRSSISVTADTEQGLWASFELFRGDDGLVSGGVQRWVAAGAQDQWAVDRLFPGLVRDGVPMTVRVTLPKRGIAFASLVDNVSTDSAIYPGMTPATQWIVPVVAHIPGKEGSFWSSTVSLWNSAASETSVQLEYLPDRTDNSAGGILTPEIRLDPFETLTIEDVALSQFGIGDGKGVLMVTASKPVTVSSRVSTAGPVGGVSGNGVRTVEADSWSNGEVVLTGVRLLGGYRTNVGFVTGDREVNFGIALYDGDGTVVASTNLRVAPRTLRQLSVEKIFGNGFVAPTSVATLKVTGDGDFHVYMTVIDGTSQDPIFVMPL
jgi:hypothetical protein